jgi:SHS2 domain-containing protein
MTRKTIWTVAGVAALTIAGTTAAFSQLAPWAALPLGAQDGKVTIRLNDATPQQVFDQLRAAGLNFVVETSGIEKGKRLTLNLQGQPADKALAAVADALGLSVSKKGDVYALRPGFDATIAPRVWSGDMPKGWDKEFKGFEGLEIAPRIWMHGPDGKAWVEGKELSPEQREKLEKALKDMPDVRIEIDKALKEMPKITEEAREAIDKAMAERDKAFAEKARAFKFEGANLTKIMESLTEEQWRLHERQGHLKPSDLTPAQRELLGAKGDGEFSITIDKDGKKLTIKSK